MGNKAIDDALGIATALHIMITELETGLRLASELEEKRAVAQRKGKLVANLEQLDPETIHRHVAELLDSFIVPAWAKINRLHRLQGRCFKLESE